MAKAKLDLYKNAFLFGFDHDSFCSSSNWSFILQIIIQFTKDCTCKLGACERSNKPWILKPTRILEQSIKSAVIARVIVWLHWNSELREAAGPALPPLSSWMLAWILPTTVTISWSPWHLAAPWTRMAMTMSVRKMTTTLRITSTRRPVRTVECPLWITTTCQVEKCQKKGHIHLLLLSCIIVNIMSP